MQEKIRAAHNLLEDYIESGRRDKDAKLVEIPEELKESESTPNEQPSEESAESKAASKEQPAEEPAESKAASKEQPTSEEPPKKEPSAESKSAPTEQPPITSEEPTPKKQPSEAAKPKSTPKESSKTSEEATLKSQQSKTAEQALKKESSEEPVPSKEEELEEPIPKEQPTISTAPKSREEIEKEEIDAIFNQLDQKFTEILYHEGTLQDSEQMPPIDEEFVKEHYSGLLKEFLEEIKAADPEGFNAYEEEMAKINTKDDAKDGAKGGPQVGAENKP
jgi:hypothetical protein